MLATTAPALALALALAGSPAPGLRPLRAELSIPYRTTGAIPLAELAPELASGPVAIRHVSGPRFEYRLRPGNVLAVLAPAEQYRDTSSVLELEAGGRRWALSLRWSSLVSLALASVDEGPPRDRARLEARGPTPDGLIGPDSPPVSFRLRNAPPAARKGVEVTLQSAREERDVTGWFALDGRTATLSVRGEHRADLARAVEGAGSLSLTIVFGAPEGRAWTFEQRLDWAAATITVDAPGATGAAEPALVTLRGEGKGVTRLLRVAPGGSATATGLPSDTYQAVAVDLERGDTSLGTVVVSAEQPHGRVSLPPRAR